MSEQSHAGWVTRMQSGFITVKTEGAGGVVCRLRGRLKKNRFEGDILAIGDKVMVSILADGSGMIEEITPRTHELARMAPTPRGEFRQVLVANPDQIVLVFACAHPEPRLRMLDRFLVICEKQRIPVLIVANKADLVAPAAAEAIFAVYARLGYPLLYTSVAQRRGVDELHQHLQGKLSGLAGPSGVGKSSLLNAIQPDLGLAVRAVSDTTTKGRHTTVVRELFPLQGGGFVADLPGLKSLALWDTEPEEIDGYFPELRDLVAECQFNNCTHRSEPGCAVRREVTAGRVAEERYQSYLRMRYSKEELSES
jgi:ribosome biogenesis GTPase / thiamine phosphate phosphatase